MHQSIKQLPHEWRRIGVDSSWPIIGDEEEWHGDSWFALNQQYSYFSPPFDIVAEKPPKKIKRANKNAPQEISAKQRTHTKRETVKQREVRGTL